MNIDFTNGNATRQIIYFTLPMLLGSVFQQLYSTVDSIIVGRFIGKEAMAAISGADPIITLLVSFLTGITIGFTILISQYFGAGCADRVRESIDTCFIFTFVVSVSISVLGIALSKHILLIIGTPDDAIALSKRYLDIIFGGLIFLAGYNAIASILRGMGDSLNPLIFLVISTVTNIVLDLVLIVVFKAGIEGAAYATIISQGISFLFGAVYLNQKHDSFKVNFLKLKYNLNSMTSAMKYGVPTATQQILMSFSGLALQSLVNSYGTSAMAAFGAANKIEGFVGSPTMNLSNAVSTFTAQNIGAGKLDRVKNGLKVSLVMASVIAVTIFIVLSVFCQQLIGIFNDDIEVIMIGASQLRTVSPFYIMICTSIMFTSVMKGAGDTMFSLLSSIFSWYVVRIPSAYLLTKYTSAGINGIWISQCIGWSVGWIITYLYYKGGNWKSKSVL